VNYLDTFDPAGGIYLQNIFGEQKRLRARIKEMNLIDHRILLEEG
jgi:predicted RNA-binding protein